MNKKNIKVSMTLNITTFILVFLSCLFMFTGFKFMKGSDLVLNVSRIEMLKFFTVDSNIILGITSLILFIYEMKLLNKKIPEIPRLIYTLKLMGVVGTTLTFLVVFLYLGPISEGGIRIMLMNANLFLHLINPLLGIISFLFIERTNKLKFKDTYFGLVPMLLYSIFYITNILIHMKNGRVSPLYDWYFFVQNGVWTAFIVVPFMFLFTYLISFSMYKINKKR